MRKLLLMATAAVGIAAAAPAYADTFVYSSETQNGLATDLSLSGTVNGQAVNESASVGQIDLIGSRNGGPTVTLPAWCLDIFHQLAGSGTYTITPLTTAGSGTPNPMLSTTQINQIGALMVEGDMAIANNTEGLDGSAAFQLAIWNIEYQGELLSSADGFLAGVVSQLVTNVGSGGIWANVGSTVDLLDAVPGNQVLAFAVPTATPLPAALPMFVGGLGVLGLLSRRRKRAASSVFAAAA